MMFHKIIKGVAPVFGLALAFGVAGCDGHISINGEDGVPLSELKTEDKTPHELVAAGPDTVIVTKGDKLTIDTSGDPEAVKALRFTLDDDTLGVMRAKGDWKDSARATVKVTLPMLDKLVVAGSGTVETAELSGKADVTIAGSGKAKTAAVKADTLEVTIAGSGAYEAAGSAKSLDLNVLGSGKADMGGLKVDSADIKVAGSGSASFASDGKVDAKIMGSGDVTVAGDATCTVSSMGSGTLKCTRGTTASDSDASDGVWDKASDAPTE